MPYSTDFTRGDEMNEQVQLSDEELVEKFQCTIIDAFMAVERPSAREILIEQFELRTQILERMKAKGPTRGEVERKASLIATKAAEEARGFVTTFGLGEAFEDLLSMFPEGE